MSTASCSSPNELTQAVPAHEAVRTLKAMVRWASPRDIMIWRSLGSGVACVVVSLLLLLFGLWFVGFQSGKRSSPSSIFGV